MFELFKVLKRISSIFLSWYVPFQIWNFSIEIMLIQFFIVYNLYLLFSSNNVYYTLLYLFFEIILFGLFISFYQMELFTGFLWVIEGTIVFIALLLLFYLNAEITITKILFDSSKFYYIFSLIVYFFFFFEYSYLYQIETFLPLSFNYVDLWENYYEALNNSSMNDFLLLFISYYSLNSIEFIIIGFLLLIGSVVCVQLSLLQKELKVTKLDTFSKIFDFTTDFINFVFLRKQNLNKQTSSPISLRIFKKKN